MSRPPSNNHVTILDVAAESGVSYGTVSRVINNDPHVKTETRERVVVAMDRLGYVINRQARSLAGGKTNIIGMLVPDLGTGYIGEIIRGVDAELGLYGYDMMLYTTHRTAAKEASYVANLAQGMVDGLVLVLPRNPVDYIGILMKRKLPVCRRYQLAGRLSGRRIPDRDRPSRDWIYHRLDGFGLRHRPPGRLQSRLTHPPPPIPF
jgi:LacI family transcriptional regulator